jgi:hypothetical protein
MTRAPKWPEPGIYYDGVPWGKYLKLEAVNSGLLRDMTRQTPKHARYFRHRGLEPTAAMKLGSAVNHRVLEQDMAIDTIAIWRERKSNGHMMPQKGAKWDAFAERNPGRTIINETTWDEAGFVAAGIRRNRAAVELFRRRRGTEVTVLWLRDGVLCKARIDVLGRDWLVVDLKVCGVSLAKRKFAYHAWGYRWDMQAAWYQEALLAHDIDCPGAALLAVEAKQPHDCVLYRWPERALDEAHEANGEAFARLQECEREQKWPGHGETAMLDEGPWKDNDGQKLDWSDS